MTGTAGRAAVAEILAERARALAVPLHSAEPADTVDLVVLAIGPEWYGLDTRFVLEVQPLVGLARVPGLPSVWAGVANVRGTLRPVLDLRHYLGLPAGPQPPGAGSGRKVSLVSDAGLTVGLLVDDAVEIRRVPAALIGPPLVGPTSAARRQIRGVTPDLLTVLDVAGLLADLRLVVREEPT
ncbi:MAG TPA: chemotaxis protein CheW [Mycobacteriales bacterium]|nr:chemotaxis protein CheW [Mycobacteriales bacterium]